MTTTVDVRTDEWLDAEALFRQARRRRRRRRMIGLAVLVGAGGFGAALFTATRPSPAKHVMKPRAQSPRAPVGVPVARVLPERPYNLAVAPTGALYLVDAGRDQILELAANGKFAVVAGTGRAGWTGDGGPARKAELRLSGSSGIVVAKNGTLYFADSGNRRVRAVLTDGTISTVAGNGKDGMLLDDQPASNAAIGSVAGLAIGPDGDLYIAGGSVMRRTPQGMLDWVAGAPFSDVNHGLPSCGTISCNPAGEGDFTEPDQLALDRAGDLFVSDGNGFGLYEIARSGALTYLGQFRGDGAPGALAPAADGRVIEAWRDGLSYLVPTPPALPGVVDARTLPYAGKLDAALAQGAQRNYFIGGDGVAVAPNGDIYVDTNAGNSFTTVSALLRINRAGVVTTIWKS